MVITFGLSTILQLLGHTHKTRHTHTTSLHHIHSHTTQFNHVFTFTHRDVMALSTLKQSVYEALELQMNERGEVQMEMKMVEARLNIMQAVFLAIQMSSSLGEDILVKGLHIFHALFNNHFTDTLEVPMLGRAAWLVACFLVPAVSSNVGIEACMCPCSLEYKLVATSYSTSSVRTNSPFPAKRKLSSHGRSNVSSGGGDLLPES